MYTSAVCQIDLKLYLYELFLFSYELDVITFDMQLAKIKKKSFSLIKNDLFISKCSEFSNLLKSRPYRNPLLYIC